MKPGTQGIEYSVSDGRNSTKGTVTVKVMGPDEPLQQARDPARRRPRRRRQAGPAPAARQRHRRRRPDRPRGHACACAASCSPGAAQVDTNLDTGVVTVTGPAPGTFEMTLRRPGGFGASPRAASASTSCADPTADCPPVAVPDAATLRDQTPVIADVLANDYSPRSDVLVTRVSPSPRRRVAAGLDRTRAAGSASRRRPRQPERTATHAAPSATRSATARRPPTARWPCRRSRRRGTEGAASVVDDAATVRVGDAVTIPVLDNDTMADGHPAASSTRPASR